MLNLLDEPPLPIGIIDAEPESITVEEYHRRVDSGKILKSDHAELIRGRVVARLPMKPLHAATVDSLGERLRFVLPTGWFPRLELPITLADSEPRPDAIVVRGTRSDYFEHHPRAADLALVVEVALRSLNEDRETKRLLYAEAGIPSYWIVNLIDGQIEVYSEPSEGNYLQVRYYANEDPVSVIIEGVEIGRIALCEFTRL